MVWYIYSRSRRRQKRLEERWGESEENKAQEGGRCGNTYTVFSTKRVPASDDLVGGVAEIEEGKGGEVIVATGREDSREGKGA